MKRVNRHDVSRAENGLRARGIHVKELGRKHLHDYAGMNTEAARTMGFPCGDKEIQVSRESANAIKLRDLRHEAFEYRRMKMGVPYGVAHVEALHVESAEDVAPATMLKVADYPKNATIVKVHDDGDITYRDSRGSLHVKTTEGHDFKEAKALKRRTARIPR